MSDTVIKVEGLGKKYMISHETSERYATLRDTISQKAKGILDKKKQTAKEEFWALKDIQFEVKRGEAIGIIGRNGAGKSTLLKLLSRITEPTEGRIEIDGKTSSLLEVGTGFHPELTGRENIFLNGAILGMSRIEIKKKFDDIVDFSGVEQFLDTPVKRYSSGMYLRLAFAIAAYLEPEILIVDEVLAVGDAEFQKKCLWKMEEVSRKEGRTVLFVSHNLKAINDFCKRVIWIEEGRIKLDDVTNAVISNYINAFDFDTSRKTKDTKDPGVPILIQGTRIIDNNRKAKFVFEVGNKIGIVIEIKNVSWTDKFVIGFALNTLSKGRILIDTAEFSSIEINSIKEIIAWLPAELLTPNTYIVDLSVLSTDNKVMDLNMAVTSFEISISNTKFESMGYDYGVFSKELIWGQDV